PRRDRTTMGTVPARRGTVSCRGKRRSGGAAERRDDRVVRVDALLQRAPDRGEDLRHARLADAEHAADLGALHVLHVEQDEDRLLALAERGDGVAEDGGALAG